MENETLAGQKLSASNSSCMPSPLSLALWAASSSMATTQVLSKDGTTVSTATEQQTKPSNRFTNSYEPFRTALRSSHNTPPANSIQKISPPEEYSAHLVYSSPTFHSLSPYARSLLTRSLPLLSQSELPAGREEPPLLHRKLTTTFPVLQHTSGPLPLPSQPLEKNTQHSSFPALQPHCHFDTPIESPMPAAPASTPLPYHADLVPKPSPLRPHCLAKDCLWLWLPATNTVPSHTIVILEDQVHRVMQVINHSWNDSTKATYGTGLLIFHIFCDRNDIPESSHCPAPASLLLVFIVSCTGFYLGSTISNYVAGLKAWHTLHRQAWSVNPDSLKRCLEGMVKLAPVSAKCPQRAPFTTNIIILFRQYLCLNEPLDAAIFVCMVPASGVLPHSGNSQYRQSKPSILLNMSPALQCRKCVIATTY